MMYIGLALLACTAVVVFVFYLDGSMARKIAAENEKDKGK